jgi:hypothetical protein
MGDGMSTITLVQPAVAEEMVIPHRMTMFDSLQRERSRCRYFGKLHRSWVLIAAWVQFGFGAARPAT